MDYVVTPDPASVFMDEVSLQFVPVTVNVTLASDGIGGEGTEDIVLTLVQLPPFEPERVLVNPTVRIIVEDNGSMYCSSGRLYHILIMHKPTKPYSLSKHNSFIRSRLEKIAKEKPYVSSSIILSFSSFLSLYS